MDRYVTQLDLQVLNSGFEFWNRTIPVNRFTIISYINGVALMLKSKDIIPYGNGAYLFSGLMRAFIWEKYKVYHHDLERCINQLAIKADRDWVEVFIEIYESFQSKLSWDNGYANIQSTPIFESFSTEKISCEVKLDRYTTTTGVDIRVGSQLQLGDLMEDDFLNTLCYDPDLECPEWDLFIPSERSFKYVKFLSGEVVLGRVVAAYSLMISKVQCICNLDDIIIVNTEYFSFEIEKAISNSEVILSNDFVDNINQEWQQRNMINFKGNEGLYWPNLYTDEEFWDGIIGFEILTNFPGKKRTKSLRHSRGFGLPIKEVWLRSKISD